MRVIFLAFLVTLAFGLTHGAIRQEFTYPGWSPEPEKGELPITSGMIVNIKSHVLGTYCTTGASNTIRCDSKEPGQFLIIGNDFATNKIYDGGKITIKSQESFKVCGTDESDDRVPVVCDTMYSGSDSGFVITAHKDRALSDDDDDTVGKRRGHSNTYYAIAPAAHPKRNCYPAGSLRDSDPATDAATVDGLKRDHTLVCDGYDEGRSTTLFSFIEHSYYLEEEAAASK